MNYFEHLNYFFSYAQFRNLPTATRITHLAILHKWNALRRTASFSLSDSELKSLTGLSSGSITSAKRQLKNLGFLDFKSTKAGTVYRIPADVHRNVPNKNEVSVQPVRKSEHKANISTATKVTNPTKQEESSAREGDWDWDLTTT